MSGIPVTIIGQRTEIPAGLTVARLLEHLGLDARLVAVEHNREILRRAHYPEVEVRPGDEIEVAHFVGGG